ncbi:hypothetical protein L6164_022501 [Bauhinia variegata]|uniref:Uncharacterized protein n=1 Tax=Bauhinia variegata TaxID=167791 RepID=A0ACB9MGS8_BAUVA|nr:hypothetical protein L6164_022501 [Bauhinia variegata]
MGGGGAMRTAAKVAGIGVATNGMRGGPLASPSEQSLRKVPRLVPTALSSQGGTKEADVAPLHTAASWEMDDWDFADEDGLVMRAGEPVPRVVFGAAPSFHEAKAATSELKDAINQIYLSSNSAEGSSADSKTESRVIQAISTTSVPDHAIQAFKLLSGSPEAQTVVASIASDVNVWNAVMQNPVLKDFVQSQEKTVAGYEAEESRKKLEDLSVSVETGSSRNDFDFMGVLQNIKLAVAEMLGNVSNFLQSVFNFPAAEKSSGDDTKTTFGDQMILGGTFFGLVVLVAMVVILKRV